MHPLSRTLRAIWQPSQEKFLPQKEEGAEALRHAHLIIGFSSVGGLFSIIFAFYYMGIGHYPGAQAILVSSLIFITLPLICLKRGKADLAALIFVLSLVAMFSWLSLIEGGVNGHAVAWLTTMPFCSQLLILKRTPMIIVNVLTLCLVAFLSGLEVLHIQLPIAYPGGQHGWVTLVGYTGLAFFMFALGYIVEYYRRKVMEERDQAESELKSAVEELTKLNLEKNEFLGIAAHDLNNPLSVIYGYAEMMSQFDGLAADQVKEYSIEIADSSKRMKKIIQDVLDVNTIESGKYPLRLEWMSLLPLVESALHQYREALREKNILLDSDLADVEAAMDPGALGQVLDNLISNAVKYTPPEGKIEIRLHRVGEQIEFEVYNEGRGFSEEDKQKLYSRFGKLSTRPTAGEGSVGLGLSITYKIIQAMKGTIECESELNQGARFRVMLPCGTA